MLYYRIYQHCHRLKAFIVLQCTTLTHFDIRSESLAKTSPQKDCGCRRLRLYVTPSQKARDEEEGPKVNPFSRFQHTFFVYYNFPSQRGCALLAAVTSYVLILDKLKPIPLLSPSRLSFRTQPPFRIGSLLDDQYETNSSTDIEFLAQRSLA